MRQNRRKPDDRIQRCAQFVADIGEEFRFGLVGRLGEVFGFFQLLIFLVELAIALADRGVDPVRVELLATETAWLEPDA